MWDEKHPFIIDYFNNFLKRLFFCLVVNICIIFFHNRFSFGITDIKNDEVLIYFYYFIGRLFIEISYKINTICKNMWNK